MSKKDQAFVLYAELLKTNPTPTRQQTIDMLVEKLEMTAAGASTYASMVRKNDTPPVIVSHKNSTPSPKKTQHNVIDETSHTPKSGVADDSSKVDKRQLYSKCYFKGDEMIFSSSHYNAEDAKNFVPSSSYTKKKVDGLESFTIVGVPTDTDTVSFLKNKYKVIS